ncbi:uncharacterized protein [Nicotiana sylvestris]|uniref:uncharacterized protein n=1 Tax=Nicotiana sylvestris TaxID=4096 RepID=UPI00388C7DA8
MPTGKLAKWQILLSEFDIIYVTQKAVIGQALANHLAENHVGGEYEPLKTYFPNEEVSFVGEDITEAYDSLRMFFDRAVNFKGVGIGAVLVSETGQHHLVYAKLRATISKLEKQVRDLKFDNGLQAAADEGEKKMNIAAENPARSGKDEKLINSLRWKLKEKYDKGITGLEKKINTLESEMTKQAKNFKAEREDCYALMSQIEEDLQQLQEQNHTATQVMEARSQQIGHLLQEKGIIMESIRRIVDYIVMKCNECEDMTKSMFFVAFVIVIENRKVVSLFGILETHPYNTMSKHKAITAGKELDANVIDLLREKDESEPRLKEELHKLKHQMAEMYQAWMKGHPPLSYPANPAFIPLLAQSQEPSTVDLSPQHAPSFNPYHHYHGTTSQTIQAPPAKTTTYPHPPTTPIIVAPTPATLHRSSSEPVFQA